MLGEKLDDCGVVGLERRFLDVLFGWSAAVKIAPVAGCNAKWAASKSIGYAYGSALFEEELGRRSVVPGGREK